ncbi:MAG: hypothetical protein A3C90_03490 [Candidatus Magasanikbacteria bacterium RIFCSPHIGHO2_02_FULL_51_14]|uniref:2'-5' RNA ligase n=1 Tax=Candidatus Magasanikbacteria bacterium RIFCSPHIGHO2_02_FULL_51_14 TaxID=1798683 RepID=A0A1F6MNY2_9BACT|nr:MAG: hypothetical protein A3C90_03490 [Candidatus Magasanikbacteria bacterium RIFCSPHIGHO2_02_FULL_51_14]
MKKIPLDIVLLPSDEIVDLCIELSRRAYERGENKFLRNKVDRLPHATLLMGCSRDTEIQNVLDAVGEIAQKTMPLTLTITKQYAMEDFGGLEIQNTDDLTALHEEIVQKVYPLLHQDCEISDLVEDAGYALGPESRIYTNTFVPEWSGKKFWPHITTHNRKEEDIALPVTFVARTLAVCPMGDRGTCRKPLATFTMRNVS